MTLEHEGSHDAEACTVAELRKAAKTLGIKGRWRMRKAQLLNALRRLPGFRELLRAGDDILSEAEKTVAVETERTARLLADDADRVSVSAASTDDGDVPSAGSSGNHPRIPAGLRAEVGRARAPSPCPSPPPRASAIPRGSHVGLVAVDPRQAFVFWRLEPADLERARTFVRDASAPLVLRIHVAGPGSKSEPDGGSYIDVGVDGSESSQYVQVGFPGRTIFCELGARGADRFVAVAWSSLVELPAGREAARFEYHTGSVLPSRARGSRPRAEAPLAGPGIPVADAALASEIDDPSSFRASPSDRNAKPSAPAIPSMESEVEHIQFSSGELQRRRSRTIPTAPALDLPSSGSLPTSSAFSSSTVGGRRRRESTTAEAQHVEANVVVRGRGTPGAHVVVHGVRVPVRADGTFELTVPLRFATDDRSAEIELRDCPSFFGAIDRG